MTDKASTAQDVTTMVEDNSSHDNKRSRETSPSPSQDVPSAKRVQTSANVSSIACEPEEQQQPTPPSSSASIDGRHAQSVSSSGDKPAAIASPVSLPDPLLGGQPSLSGFSKTTSDPPPPPFLLYQNAAFRDAQGNPTIQSPYLVALQRQAQENHVASQALKADLLSGDQVRLASPLDAEVDNIYNLLYGNESQIESLDNINAAEADPALQAALLAQFQKETRPPQERVDGNYALYEYDIIKLGRQKNDTEPSGVIDFALEKDIGRRYPASCRGRKRDVSSSHILHDVAGRVVVDNLEVFSGGAENSYADQCLDGTGFEGTDKSVVVVGKMRGPLAAETKMLVREGDQAPRLAHWKVIGVTYYELQDDGSELTCVIFLPCPAMTSQYRQCYDNDMLQADAPFQAKSAASIFFSPPFGELDVCKPLELHEINFSATFLKVASARYNSAIRWVGREVEAIKKTVEDLIDRGERKFSSIK